MTLQPFISDPQGHSFQTSLLMLLALLLASGCAASNPPQSTNERAQVAYQAATEPLDVSTYVLSAGDEIRITVHGHAELDRTYRILPDGRIFFPSVGDIQVHGMSIPELRSILVEGLESADEQRIASGDEIQIDVYRHEDLDVVTVVPSSGRINMPLAGDVTLQGLTVDEANATIAEALSRFVMSPSVRTTIRDSVTTGRIVDPQISVEVLRFGGQKVVVLGEVTTPGVYLSEGQSRLLDVVALAGGPTPHARLRTVAVLRPGTPSSPPVGMLADLRLVLEQGDFSQNLPVQRGDVIFVPTTTIANVAQFFEYLYAIVRPIVTVETGIWLGQNISEGPRRSPGNTIIFQ